MANATIFLSPDDASPAVHLGQLDTGERFAYMFFGDSVTLHFPGNDYETLTVLRAFAETLTQSVAELSALLPPEPPAPAVEPLSPPPDAPERIPDEEIIF